MLTTFFFLSDITTAFKRNWAKCKRKDFLEKGRDGFRNVRMLGSARAKEYTRSVCNRWFETFNWRLALDEDPDDFPLFNDTNLSTDEKAKKKLIVERFQKSIHNWYETRVTETTVKPKKKKKKDPVWQILCALAGGQPVARRLAGYQCWSKGVYSTALKKAADDAFSASGLPESHRSSIRQKIVKAAFDALPEAEQLKWELKSKADHEKKEEECELGQISLLDPEQIQQAIDRSPKILGPLLHGIHVLFGMHVSLFFSRPEPRKGGQINAISMHHGVDLSPAGVDWAHSSSGNYRSAEKAFLHYVKGCYSTEEQQLQDVINSVLGTSSKKKTKKKGKKSSDPSSNEPSVQSPLPVDPEQPSSRKSSKKRRREENEQVVEDERPIRRTRSSMAARSSTEEEHVPNVDLSGIPLTGPNDEPTGPTFTIPLNTPFSSRPSSEYDPDDDSNIDPALREPQPSKYSAPARPARALSLSPPAPDPALTKSSLPPARPPSPSTEPSPPPEDQILPSRALQPFGEVYRRDETAFDVTRWPAWLVKARAYLDGIQSDGMVIWQSLLELLVDFEARADFGSAASTEQRKSLGCIKRPREVHDWIARGRRQSSTLTQASLSSFKKSWCEWWKLLQPDWREAANVDGFLDESHRQGKGEWGSLDKVGQNGLYSVVVCLGWWGALDRSEDWQQAVLDVAWVMSSILGSG
ncbi:hypothetical protein C8J56DRAFT_787208 [Mycena floridula]|nr:hypothetical protein C8J56DRAFT_787208 [Mycena floridula]